MFGAHFGRIIVDSLVAALTVVRIIMVATIIRSDWRKSIKYSLADANEYFKRASASFTQAAYRTGDERVVSLSMELYRSAEEIKTIE